MFPMGFYGMSHFRPGCGSMRIAFHLWDEREKARKKTAEVANARLNQTSDATPATTETKINAKLAN